MYCELCGKQKHVAVCDRCGRETPAIANQREALTLSKRRKQLLSAVTLLSKIRPHSGFTRESGLWRWRNLETGEAGSLQVFGNLAASMRAQLDLMTIAIDCKAENRGAPR